LKFKIKKSSSNKIVKPTSAQNNAVQKVDQKITTIKVKPDADIQATLDSFATITKLDYQSYPVYTGIVKDPTAPGGQKYVIIEPTFTAQDRKNFETIRRILMVELSVDLNDISSKKLAEVKLEKKIKSIIKKYRLDVPQRAIPKLVYHAVRNFIYLGKIEPLMHDPMIEEISCDGVGIPLYIWHREQESMPTNIIFKTSEELDQFARHLAYVCNQHVSLAQPIIDASLPGGDRMNLTLGDEITKHGSTFTIRRFREDFLILNFK